MFSRKYHLCYSVGSIYEGLCQLSNVSDIHKKNIKGYEIIDLIDEGGFSAVYRAKQPIIEREVAVKVILPRYANRPAFIRRFHSEAQLVARLEHINIVPLYDYWRDPDGAYLVMRWLRGGSLFTLLNNPEEWTFQKTGRLLDQIASALAAAHSIGVVHRDIKPGNILLDDEQNAYLADFGIALELGVGQDDNDALIGSPGYISPEQIRSEEVSPLSDQYSLGILIYQILTGYHPYTDSEKNATQNLILSHLESPVPSLRTHLKDTPPQIDPVLQRATHKDPKHRYPSILEFAAAFQTAISPLPVNLPTNDEIDDETLIITEAETRDITADSNIVLPKQENPYKGLRAFEEADANQFFGRKNTIGKLLSRLQQDVPYKNFLALVGPSGSGKSSVVNAGLIPQLRQGAIEGSDNWFYVDMVPGKHPIENLASALTRVAVHNADNLSEQLYDDTRGITRALKRILPTDDQTKLFLFINQFEEVFTQMSNEAERQHFLESLQVAASEPNSRLRLMITLRADFYDRPLLYELFGQMMQGRTEVVLPLSADELREAIVAPAERSRLHLEQALVNTIIDDVRRESGALPLLQYALTELYERRFGNTLTLEAYNMIGGVSGALVQRAEDVYNQLELDEKDLARQIFMRLVSIGDGTEDTRRRAARSELLTLTNNPDDLQKILERFGNYRLLTFDHDQINRTPTVEIAHEALIRRWVRFTRWLDDNREELQLQRRIAVQAQEWKNAGEDPSFLAVGVRLQQFEQWFTHTQLGISLIEMQYVTQSIYRRERLKAEEAERQAREEALEKRSQDRLRALLTVMFIAVIIAGGLATYAALQNQEARENAEEAAFNAERAEANAQQAEANAQQAEANAEAAEASSNQAQSLAWASAAQLVLGDNNTDLAIALSLQATTRNVSPSPEAQRALAAAAYNPGTRTVFTGHAGDIWDMIISPDETRAITSSLDGTVIVWDIETGEMLRVFEEHTAPVRAVAIDPSGTMVLTGADNGRILQFNLTNTTIREYDSVHLSPIYSIAFTPGGSQVATGHLNGNIIVWNTRFGTKEAEWETPNGTIWSLSYGRQGTLLYSGSNDGTIAEWNSEDGSFVNRYIGHNGAVRHIAISPTGRQMLSTSVDRSILYWDLRTGIFLRELVGHTEGVYTVDFTPDGASAYSGGQDSSIIHWELESGAILKRLQGHTGAVSGLYYLPEGQRLISSSFDNSIRIWDTLHGLQINEFSAHRDEVYAVAYSPDGRYIASGGADNTIYLWDVRAGAFALRMQGHAEDIQALAFTPDGQAIISGGDDRILLMFDVATGDLIRNFQGMSDRVRDLAISGDGRYVIAGGNNNLAIIWDIETGEQVQVLEGHENWIRGVDINADGTQALTGSADTTIILWDVATGEPIRTLRGHDDWVWDVAFSSVDGFGVSTGSDSLLIYWDLTTGQIIRRLAGHTAPIYEVKLSPDGQTAITASADQTVRVWELETGAELGRLTGHTSAVYSIAIEPFGRFIASASGDFSVRYWDTPFSFNKVIEWTFANRYVRELTCVERSVYRVTPLCPNG